MQLQQPGWLLCVPFESCPSGSVILVVVKSVASTSAHLASEVDSWSQAEVEDVHGQAFCGLEPGGHSRWCYIADPHSAPHHCSRSRSNAPGVPVCRRRRAADRRVASCSLSAIRIFTSGRSRGAWPAPDIGSPPGAALGSGHRMCFDTDVNANNEAQQRDAGGGCVVRADRATRACVHTVTLASDVYSSTSTPAHELV